MKDLYRANILYSVLISHIGRSWGRAVGIATGYGLNNTGARVQDPAG